MLRVEYRVDREGSAGRQSVAVGGAQLEAIVLGHRELTGECEQREQTSEFPFLFWDFGAHFAYSSVSQVRDRLKQIG